jgi:hypothetical protein
MKLEDIKFLLEWATKAIDKKIKKKKLKKSTKPPVPVSEIKPPPLNKPFVYPTKPAEPPPIKPPSVIKPTDVKSAETNPSTPKPAEPKPSDTKPSDVKTPDTKTSRAPAKKLNTLEKASDQPDDLRQTATIDICYGNPFKVREVTAVERKTGYRNNVDEVELQNVKDQVDKITDPGYYIITSCRNPQSYDEITIFQSKICTQLRQRFPHVGGFKRWTTRRAGSKVVVRLVDKKDSPREANVFRGPPGVDWYCHPKSKIAQEKIMNLKVGETLALALGDTKAKTLSGVRSFALAALTRYRPDVKFNLRIKGDKCYLTLLSDQNMKATKAEESLLSNTILDYTAPNNTTSKDVVLKDVDSKDIVSNDSV